MGAAASSTRTRSADGEGSTAASVAPPSSPAAGVEGRRGPPPKKRGRRPTAFPGAKGRKSVRLFFPLSLLFLLALFHAAFAGLVSFGEI